MSHLGEYNFSYGAINMSDVPTQPLALGTLHTCFASKLLRYRKI